MPRSRAVAAALLIVLAAAPTAVAAGRQRFFVTPPPARVSCELDVGMPGLPNAVSCLFVPHSAARAVSALLRADGTLRLCRGIRCVGNAPEGTPTLVAGRSASLGPFRCTAGVGGVRCVVTRSGRGFELGPAGVRRI